MMMKVRVSSESFGSGKPNIVYRSCHERMTAAIARAIRRGVFNKTRLEGKHGMTRLYTNRKKGILRKKGIRMANKKFTNLANTMGMRGERQKRQDERDTESKKS